MYLIQYFHRILGSVIWKYNIPTHVDYIGNKNMICYGRFK